MNLYRLVLRPLLFRLDAETAHRRAVAACRVAGALPLVPALARACLNFTAPELQTEVAGLRVENPVGLAAGCARVSVKALLPGCANGTCCNAARKRSPGPVPGGASSS